MLITLNFNDMKRIFKAACAAALIVFAFSTASAQVNIGLKAGLNLSNVIYHDPVDDVPKVLPSFQAGGLAEFALREYLSLEVGLQLQGKGYQFNADNDLYRVHHQLNPWYIQVPVMVTLHGNGIFGGVGPYAGMGISGGGHSIKYTPFNNEGTANKTHEAIHFGNGVNDDIAPMEFGGVVEFGYASKKGLRFTFSYQAGFTDWRPADQRDALPNASLTSRVASFCVTYMFRVK